MTILVCYMRNFAEFSGKLTTEENFLFINSFLRTFGPVIREYGGFTSRYLGPGMLAMFPNDAGSALQAAMKLRVALEAYNAGRARSGYEPVEIGIAVHTGDVMLGIIGEEQRMEGSVVSPHVDLALDMERLSAKLGVSILITEATLQSAKTVPVHYRRLGAIQLDGDQPPVELVDVFEHDPPHIRNLKRATKAQFEAAVEAFRQGRFYDAREGFVDVVKRNRYDLAAKLYFFASDRYYQEGAPQSWSHALRIS
jgi:class 3 adenylate cyclase